MDSKKLLKMVKEEVEAIESLLMIDAQTSVDIDPSDEGVTIVKVKFDGDDLGYMIGSHGRHLSSLQYIFNSILRNKVRQLEEEMAFTILVDVGGYREQKQEGVEKLALQKADDARILGEAIDLPPMSSSDRRVVHTALSKFDDLKTESFGEGRDRYVRITPLSEKELGIIQETEDNEDDEQQEQSEE